jgi:hypothetical protein
MGNLPAKNAPTHPAAVNNASKRRLFIVDTKYRRATREVKHRTILESEIRFT